MINFRYHLVSLAAVFVALAAGIGLGAGWLEDTDDDETTSEARIDPAVVSFENAFAGRTAAPLITGSLNGRRVLVVTAPGAKTVEVEGLTANLQQAGAAVVGEIALTPTLLDASNRQFAEEVAQNSAQGVEGIDAAGDSYARVGAAIARGFVSTDDPAVDEAAATIRSAFREAKLIDLTTEPQQQADLVMVVTGSTSASAARGSILADVTGRLAAGGGGAALVGPSPTSGDSGILAQVRADESAGGFSTVDVIDTAAGRVVAVMALARAANGEYGEWGTTRSADGALPN